MRASGRLAVWVVAAVSAVTGAAWAATPTSGSAPPVPAAPSFAKVTAMPVAKVLDGRTLVVQSEQGQEVVALLGVGPVEVGAEPKPGDKAGENASESAKLAREAAATAFLDNLLKGESVYVVDHEKGRRSDAQGRRLCSVYRGPDGLLVNLELVRQGYAAPIDEPGGAMAAALKPWGKLAIERRRGLYATVVPAAAPAIAPAAGATAEKAKPTTVKPATVAPTGDQPAPVDGMVFVTRNGTKYHRADCRYAKSGTAMSVDEAKKKGLGPCGVCKPE